MEATTVQVPGFARTLELAENERVCPTCKGAGVDVRVSIEKATGYMSVCPKCYGHGKQKTCQYCGEWSDLSVPHRCDGRRKAENAKEWAKTLDQFEKAQRFTVEEALAAGIEFCYFPGDDGDALFGVDRIDEEADERELSDRERPAWAWATTETPLSLSAESIIEQACEELHEEAYANISDGAIKELQDFLDGWVKRHGEGATTYFEDRTRAVIVPPKQSEEGTAS